MEKLRRNAPLLYGQLKSDAESDNEKIEEHLGAYKEGLSGYLAELIGWCRKELDAAQRRPKILQLQSIFDLEICCCQRKRSSFSPDIKACWTTSFTRLCARCVKCRNGE